MAQTNVLSSLGYRNYQIQIARSKDGKGFKGTVLDPAKRRVWFTSIFKTQNAVRTEAEEWIDGAERSFNIASSVDLLAEEQKSLPERYFKHLIFFYQDRRDTWCYEVREPISDQVLLQGFGWRTKTEAKEEAKAEIRNLLKIDE